MAQTPRETGTATGPSAGRAMRPMPRRPRFLVAGLNLATPACLAVASVILLLTAGPVAARSWAPRGDGGDFRATFTLEMEARTFNRTLSNLPAASWVLMEFFAPWCPACQKFRPEYERVAAFFNTAPGAAVVVARVNCEEQSELCALFNVASFPALLWGHPVDFSRRLLHLPAPPTVDPGHSADRIARWISDRLGSRFVLPARAPPPPAAPQAERPLRLAASVDLGDVEEATVLAVHYMFQGPLLPGARAAFAAWATLQAGAHPVFRCQESFARVVESLDALWPPESVSGTPGAAGLGLGPAPEMRSWRPCVRRDYEPRGWGHCRGSQPHTRGYSCGLWQLLHSLAARVPEADGGATWLAAVRGFVTHFFACEECRAHFLEMASQPAAQGVLTRRHAVLWSWRVHNAVNARLAKEEAAAGGGAGSFDPAFPKIQWPPSGVCALCRHGGDGGDGGVEDAADGVGEPAWDEESLYLFLLSYFRGAPFVALESNAAFELRPAVLVLCLVGLAVAAFFRLNAAPAPKKAGPPGAALAGFVKSVRGL